MTQYERLLQQLPPDRRVEAALALEKLSNDRDSPIFGLYAEILAGIEAKSQEREKRLVDTIAQAEEREKKLLDLIAKGHNQHQKTVEGIMAKFGQDQFWRRVLSSKIAGGITFAVCWVVGSYWLINTQIGAVKSSVDQLRAEQVATLETISKKPQGIVDFVNASMKAADKSNDTAAMLAGISAMLSTPDATLGVRDGKIVIKINSKDIEIKQEGEYTKLQIYQKVPRVLDTIEDHLDEADAALQE